MGVVFSRSQWTIKREKKPSNQALLDFSGPPWNTVWSGRWESNPRLKLGKLGYYHYTTPAPMFDPSRLSEDQASTTHRGQAPGSPWGPQGGGPALKFPLRFILPPPAGHRPN